MTASPTCALVALPPTSGVQMPPAQVSATASRTGAGGCRRSSSSIIAAERIAPIGLAMPRPTRSSADPWTGSNIEGKRPSRWRLALGRHAETAGERAREVGEDVAVQVRGDQDVDRAGIEHQTRGRRIDQQRLELRPRGESSPTSATTRSQSTLACRLAFDFVTLVTRRAGRARASSKAKRAVRSTAARV